MQIYDALRTLVARISARILVGYPTCRNDAWIEAEKKYTETSTVTTMVLRTCPRFIRPFVAPLLPSYWNTKKHVRRGLAVLKPFVDVRRAAQANSEPGYERPNDFLQWMMDAANEKEGTTEELAIRELITSLASVHTTTIAIAHVLYDMCSMPYYFDVMRQEMAHALEVDKGWQNQTPRKMHKLDSMLKESQRVNPASLREFQKHLSCNYWVISIQLMIPTI